MKKLNMHVVGQKIPPTKVLRKTLQEREFNSWCKLPYKGRGVCLFNECPKINKSLSSSTGLSENELNYYYKMVCDVAPVRSIPGRSKNGVQCRRCSTSENFIIETLPHVLGQCP